MTAPAAMPSEEIRRIIDDALNSAIPEPWEVSAHATARIEALFAPILAEWREIANAQGQQRFANLLRADAAEARALAAEAALAKMEGALARYIETVGATEGTDFIDSPGFNGPDEAVLYRCSGRDENGNFTEEARAIAAAIRAQGE